MLIKPDLNEAAVFMTGKCNEIGRKKQTLVYTNRIKADTGETQGEKRD
mgnify:CR=1 FL=1